MQSTTNYCIQNAIIEAMPIRFHLLFYWFAYIFFFPLVLPLMPLVATIAIVVVVLTSISPTLLKVYNISWSIALCVWLHVHSAKEYQAVIEI